MSLGASTSSAPERLGLLCSNSDPALPFFPKRGFLPVRATRRWLSLFAPPSFYNQLARLGWPSDFVTLLLRCSGLAIQSASCPRSGFQGGASFLYEIFPSASSLETSSQTAGLWLRSLCALALSVSGWNALKRAAFRRFVLSS